MLLKHFENLRFVQVSAAALVPSFLVPFVKDVFKPVTTDIRPFQACLLVCPSSIFSWTIGVLTLKSTWLGSCSGRTPAAPCFLRDSTLKMMLLTGSLNVILLTSRAEESPRPDIRHPPVESPRRRTTC